MDLTRRQFNLGLVSMVLGRDLLADGNISQRPEIIKPSLEEIASLMRKDPDEILKSAIEKGEIKKFEYTVNTRQEEFYKILNGFDNATVFVYLDCDESTVNGIKRRIGGEQADSGAALSFLYIIKNLSGKADVGFLFLELKKFSGDVNWRELNTIFKTRPIEFPSYVEFVRDSTGNYRFNDICGCGVKSPDKILKNIEWGIEEYSKR